MNLKKVIAVICSSLLLVGCSQSMEDKSHGLDKDSPVSITLGTLEDTSLESMINDFNETIGNDRGIIIEYKPVSSVDELTSMDMVSADYNTIYSLCSSGNVAELSEYFSSMDLGTNFYGMYIEDVSLSGLRAIPTKLDMNVLAVNKSKWESFSTANGLDISSLNTWEGINLVAETYSNSNSGEPFLSISSNCDVALEISKQLANPIVKTESNSANINISSEVMQSIWENISISQIKGYFTNGGYESLENNTTIATYCKLSEIPENSEVLVFQAPIISNSETCYKLDITAIAINSVDDTKIYGGEVFIDWLTSKDVNYKYALSSGYLPSNRECLKLDNINSYCKSYEDYNSSYTAQIVALDLINSQKVFRISPFDNISTLESTLENKINQTSCHEIVLKRIKSGVLESKAYVGFLDTSSFKVWYDDICEQLKITFNS